MAPTDGLAAVALDRGDIGEGLALSDEAGWNQIADDWAVFVDHGACFGCRVEGRLVASAAVLPFGDAFGWISMVLVTAECRRQGLASLLMSRCVEAMRRAGRVAILDATPAGAMVYARLGFRTSCGMARWRGPGLAAISDRTQPIPAIADLIARDRQAFGGDRGFLLQDFLRRPGSAVLGDARDFLVSRQGRRATQIGPLVADTGGAAHDLLDEALALASGPVIIDVLDAGASLHALLTRRGFGIVRTFERMVLDGAARPGEHAVLMAAAGPEFG